MRKLSFLGIFTLLLIGGVSDSVPSQDDELQKVIQAAMEEKKAGDYVQARQVLEAKLSSIEQYPRQQQARFYYELARIVGPTGLGELDLNLDYLEKGLELAQQDTNKRLLADFYNHFGIYYETIEADEEALKMYEKLISLSKEIDYEQGLNTGLLHSGNVWYIRGDNYRALESFKQVIGRFKDAEKPNFIAEGVVQYNIANVYMVLAEYEKEIYHYQQSLYYKQRGLPPQHPGLAINYLGLSTAFMENNQLDSAQYYVNTFFDTYAPGSISPRRFAQAYKAQGGIYMKENRLEAARESFDQALQDNEKALGSRHPFVSEIYLYLSESWEKVEDFEQALDFCQKALIANHETFESEDIQSNPKLEGLIAEDYLLQNLNSKLKLCLAAYHKSSEKKYLKIAEETARLGQDLIEQSREKFTNEETLYYFGEYALSFYEKAMEVNYILQGQEPNNAPQYQAQAFAIAESSQAYHLIRSLNEQELRKGLDQDSIILLENRLYKKQNFLEREIKGLSETDQPKEFKALQAKLWETKQAKDKVREAIKKRKPEYYAAKYERSKIEMEELQKGLNEEEYFLQFFVSEKSLYRFGIQKNSIQFESVDLPENWKALVKEFRSILGQNNAQQYYQKAKALTEIILGDFSLPETIKAIRVVPDGEIHYLPLEILLDPKQTSKINYRDLPYLIRKYRFSYHFSASLCHKNRRQENKPNSEKFNLYAFSPSQARGSSSSQNKRSTQEDSLYNLPGAAKELEEIAKVLPVQSFVGQEATEANFRSALSEASVLHLATHAKLNDQDPAFSQLILRPGSQGDGNLYAYELSGLDSKAELITLSACNTGYGVIQKGEGVMSLARAFAYTGCPSTVMSLWPVADASTSDLMSYFYLYLSQGEAKDEALRLAKLAYLENSDELLSNPYHWGGMVFNGKSAPIALPSSTYQYYWLGLILLLFLGGGLYWRWRKSS